MTKVKFLIIGISGDLSKKKILPAISQLSRVNQENIDVELLGYSRSLPGKEEIDQALGVNNLKSVEFVQGEYSDSQFFQNMVSGLSDNERLIVYFAVPPIVFLNLLETFCPCNHKNLDIIMEKPFGRNLDEAIKIISKIEECKLTDIVHFCDHYLFKSGLLPLAKEVLLLKPFVEKSIKSVHIRALEKASANGRAGYYDETGAIKDMVPAHMYSLIEFVEDTFQISFGIDDIKVENIKLGQYKAYKQDVNNPDSTTETYFKILFQGDNRPNLIIESGKSKVQKATLIEITYEDESKIIWNIDPDRAITLVDKKGQQSFKVNQIDKLDHERMFEKVLARDYIKFLGPEDTIRGWKLYEKIETFIESNNISLEEY